MKNQICANYGEYFQHYHQNLMSSKLTKDRISQSTLYRKSVLINDFASGGKSTSMFITNIHYALLILLK